MTDVARIPVLPASLSLPVKTITIDGSVFAWDEATDPAWLGDWAFPEKGWGDEKDRNNWIGTQGHLIAMKREHEATLAEGDAYAQSPAFLIANAQAEVEATKRAKEIDERRLQGAKAWTAARKQYGTNVRAIPTVEGDVVIMVGMTATESDAANAAAKMAMDQRLKADPNGQAVALSDFLATHRNWMLGKCVWPEDKARIRAIAEAHPGLWDDLTNARNEMARARVDDEGKGFAP